MCQIETSKLPPRARFLGVIIVKTNQIAAPVTLSYLNKCVCTLPAANPKFTYRLNLSKCENTPWIPTCSRDVGQQLTLTSQTDVERSKKTKRFPAGTNNHELTLAPGQLRPHIVAIHLLYLNLISDLPVCVLLELHFNHFHASGHLQRKWEGLERRIEIHHSCPLEGLNRERLLQQQYHIQYKYNPQSAEEIMKHHNALWVRC